MKNGGKVHKVMHEFKYGLLRSGSKSGPVVRDRKQAIAIALSEARRAGEDVASKGRRKRRRNRYSVKARAGAVVRREVQRPGIRGGRWYADRHGRIRYGVPPADARIPDFSGVSRHEARLTLRPSGFVAGRMISGLADVADVFREAVDDDRERFWGLHLDINSKPIAVELISVGGLDQAHVSPRECFKNAVRLGSAKIAFVHNHPTGRRTPSGADYGITETLTQLGKEIDIPVMCHLVVARDGWSEVRHGGESGDFAGGDPEDKDELSEVSGKIHEAAPPPYLSSNDAWDVVHNSDDVAKLGRLLLDPGDAVAIALMLDAGNRIVGLYPVAYSEMNSDAVTRARRLVVQHGQAANIIFIFGRDGKEWMNSVLRQQSALQRSVRNTSANILDMVIVDPDGHESLMHPVR